MFRPTGAFEAGGPFPLMAASGADTPCFEGVPVASAAAVKEFREAAARAKPAARTRRPPFAVRASDRSLAGVVFRGPGRTKGFFRCRRLSEKEQAEPVESGCRGGRLKIHPDPSLEVSDNFDAHFNRSDPQAPAASPQRANLLSWGSLNYLYLQTIFNAPPNSVTPCDLRGIKHRILEENR
jgi:hypothetical protein